jgi:hypothetical protein
MAYTMFDDLILDLSNPKEPNSQLLRGDLVDRLAPTLKRTLKGRSFYSPDLCGWGFFNAGLT